MEIVVNCRADRLSPLCVQYVFKSEAHCFRTAHEELAKGMTFDLKSNEQAAVRNVLKVCHHSMFHSLTEYTQINERYFKVQIDQNIKVVLLLVFLLELMTQINIWGLW